MIRQLFTVASVVSLLVCLAGAGAWCASYRWPRQWASGSNPGVCWTVSSDRGWMTVERLEILFWPNFRGRAVWSLDARYQPGGRNWTGFFIDRRDGTVLPRAPGATRPPVLPGRQGQIGSLGSPWYYRFSLGVAYPLVCGLSAVLPALWLWRTRVHRRRRRIGRGFEPVTSATPPRPPRGVATGER
jgi:hypothetical protein